MIKFHFHFAPRDVPQLPAKKGDRLCHVYSDLSLRELVTWGTSRGLESEWIDRRHILPHFDVRADSVSEGEPGVARAELVRDIRAWRERTCD